MQTRVSHMLFTCLLLLVCSFASVHAQSSDGTGTPFPPDPGVVYVPPVVVIMGDTIDMSDTTVVVPKEIDVRGDSTIVYNTEENVLTLTGATLEAGEKVESAISYTGTDTLVIVLCDSSSIVADTVISSQSDIIIRGEGMLVAEGDVPIIGSPNASITFDSVSMYVHSLPGGPAGVRRRIKGILKLDEDGGPALSGFSSATFNNTSVTPPEADYGEVETADASGEPTTINALYIIDEEGEVDILTEFSLTAKGDILAVSHTYTPRELDLTQPMYNILGVQVDASYRGVVIQQGHKYILK